MTGPLPSLAEAKEQARRLRARLEKEGLALSHGKALDLVAQQRSFRDWNTLHAAIGNRPTVPWTVGGRVRGHYLSQPFEAEILAVTLVQPGWFRLTLDLDEAVDVITFEGMSNVRKRVTGLVGPDGQTRERTSNGRPHLDVVALPSRSPDPR
jgi:hypothetical protein